MTGGSYKVAPGCGGGQPGNAETTPGERETRLNEGAGGHTKRRHGDSWFPAHNGERCEDRHFSSILEKSGNSEHEVLPTP